MYKLIFYKLKTLNAKKNAKKNKMEAQKTQTMCKCGQQWNEKCSALSLGARYVCTEAILALKTPEERRALVASGAATEPSQAHFHSPISIK